MLRFTVHAIPIAQPRQRVAVRGKHAVTYTPARHPVNAFKAAVQLAHAEVANGKPLEGPLEVRAVFVMPRPASLIRKTKPNPRVHRPVKPDVDNLIKSLLDGLNGLAWRDDAQVCRVYAERVTASSGEAPHVDVELGTIDL